jgi:5,10-methylene-tetrahydrofolate dehydrogenase/methenyl tetrahydrofolate cyclohydrolase
VHYPDEAFFFQLWLLTYIDSCGPLGGFNGIVEQHGYCHRAYTAGNRGYQRGFFLDRLEIHVADKAIASFFCRIFDAVDADVVIVGRSNLVGKPLANMLIQKKPNANATVTVCHTRTKDLSSHTKRADILIAAAGRPNTVTADMVKEGAVVIDVGVNRVEDSTKKRGYRLVGDVDFETVKEKASLITPVPGGVGPMTITMLLYNTVESAKRAAGIDVSK